MRKAKEADYWDRAYKRKYLNSVSGVGGHRSSADNRQQGGRQ